MECVQLDRGDAGFIRLVEEESGQKLSRCYQCGNCSAGCPMSFAYDYPVSRIMRLIQLGQKKTVLSSRAVWMCASCEACSTHCPNDIEVARVLDVCRHLSRREGYAGVRGARIFTDAFLQSVRWYGRSHELGLMAVYKMRSLRLLDDVELAPGMLLKGKLPLLPHRIKGRDEVAGIFRRYAEGRGRKK
ncbi:MAG: 4Fe-4S dicluster domain-containing protein [Deltaproteobacteria bacterium]|jgi:heterodisulfide reductase subunit C|nr:4Fe-4S dicluster domain-containing protein [Deltaproteobacteria bacterium]